MNSIYFYDTCIGRIAIADNGKAITRLTFDGKDGGSTACPYRGGCDGMERQQTEKMKCAIAAVIEPDGQPGDAVSEEVSSVIRESSCMSVETPFAIRESSYASVEVPFAIRDTSYASGEAAFAVRGISFAPEGAPFAIRDATFIVSETPLIREAAKQLEEYFVGKRKIFDIPLGPEGTPFQRAVWEALLEIPYGETRSYGDIAARIGNPKAARAVGMANNRNPIAVFVPCHRVIGASGKLVGYAGGVDVKKKLLELEKLNAAKHPHWER